MAMLNNQRVIQPTSTIGWSVQVFQSWDQQGFFDLLLMVIVDGAALLVRKSYNVCFPRICSVVGTNGHDGLNVFSLYVYIEMHLFRIINNDGD